MIAAGYTAFRMKFFSGAGQHEISTLIAKVFTPCMMISNVAGERPENAGILMRDSLILALIYFAFLIAGGLVYTAVRRPEKRKRNLDLMTLFFSNVGFFAIPLVKGLFGDAYVVYLIVYMMGYNLLIFSLGTYLAIGTGDGEGQTFSVKKIFNIGTVTAAVTLVVYVLNIPVPAPVATFAKYLGDTCVPLSMLLVGGSLAQLDLKEVVTSRENWVLTVVKMLVIPAAAVLIVRNFHFNHEMLLIFLIEMGMPCASLAGVLAEEYGRSGNEINQMIALTTLFSAISLPVLSLLL